MSATIAATTLASWLCKRQSFALIDVQEQGAFSQAHIFASSSTPYSQLEQLVASLVPNAWTRVVITDSTGSEIATKAAKRLQSLGYNDLYVLEGGNAAWQAAGHPLFDGVFLPSKTFGELVEMHYHTPCISATQLAEMQHRGEDFLLLDGRTYEEFQRFTIPGSTSCPNGELPLRVQSDTLQRKKLVINCAGRTRSILGTEILRQAGLAKDIYALENGTQGWLLAGLQLQYKAHKALAEKEDANDKTGKQHSAQNFAAQCGVQAVNTVQLEAWQSDPDHTTYVYDIRTREEFAASTWRGASHAPGGQLLQSTDIWLAVHGARVVLVDTDHIRAPIIAGWLRQMGWDAYVLPVEINTLQRQPAPARPLAAPLLETITHQQLADHLVLDLRTSQDFCKGHLPGAVWAIRSTLGRYVKPSSAVCLIGDEVTTRLAAVDVLEYGARSVHLLANPEHTETETQLTESERIDFAFHTLGRNDGNLEAARQYLAWEIGLVERLTATEWAIYPSHWPDGRILARHD